MKPLVLFALPPLHPDTSGQFGDEVELKVASDPSAETVICEGARAVAIVGRGGTKIGSEVFDALERLQIVVSGGSGADCFDVLAATQRGIAVLNNPGRIVGVPEYVLTVIPLLSKRLFQMDRAMRRGDVWPPRDRSGWEVSGKTIGVVGFGHLGREVARRAQAGWEMRVLAYDPVVDEAAFEDVGVVRVAELHALLTEADFVTVHVPLMDATRGLIGRAEFEAMKPEAIFVNASRGAVVDEQALIEVMQAGRLAAAAVDVWDPEPPSPDHPLFQLDNVFVTPHMAGVTTESRAAGAIQVADTVLSALRGVQPAHIVNPTAWPPARARDHGFPLAARRLAAG